MTGTNWTGAPSVETCTYEAECDGCLGTIKVGDLHLTNINSCCGPGCSRVLCKACVEHAALKFNPETPDAWGRTGQLL